MSRNRLGRIRLCFIVIGLCASLAAPLMAQLKIGGYLENRFFLAVYPEENPVYGDGAPRLGDYNRLRLLMDADPANNVNVHFAIDLYTFHGYITSPLGSYSDNGDPNAARIDLDRAYINLYFKKFDVTIGKQRIALGVSYLWAPLDIFNRVNVFEPKEEKPGTQALKIYVPLGSASALTGIFSPEDDFSGSSFGFRGKTQLGNVDIGLTWIRSGPLDTTVFGMDLRGETGVGWWVEAGYFSTRSGSSTKVVIGFDYSFPLHDGLYWLNEYYYDSSGETDPARYDIDSLVRGERFTLGKRYFFSMLRYSLSNFMALSLGYIANWGDGSYLLNPVWQYEISQNVMVMAGLYLPLGTRVGEFRRILIEESAQYIPGIFFVWLKVNF